MLIHIDHVKEKLAWMKKKKIWPNGLRYLWTDSFGVLLLSSLYKETKEEHYLNKAREVVAEVDKVLGREKGYRIGEVEGREGQYFHYLTIWMYALYILGKFDKRYHQKAIKIAHDIHPHFIRPGAGVYWKMTEDLSEPDPYAFGALDHFEGYVIYNLIDPEGLRNEIQQMKEIIDNTNADLDIDQDLGLGMMLWMCQFHPDEEWAKHHHEKSLRDLDRLWIDPPGYFCRQRGRRETKFAFTNYGVSIGLQATRGKIERVNKLNEFFKEYKSGDHYERDAITHVMECNSHFPGLLICDYDNELIMSH